MRIQPETAKNIRTSAIFLGLTGGMLFLIFKFGLYSAVKISEFLQKNQPVNEEVPLDSFLPVPQFFSVIEATNSAQLPIGGYSQANKEVLITLNGGEDQSLAVDSEGKFSGSLDLSLGINTFYAETKDFKGNKSLKSETQTIFYSNTPPPIEIEEPQPDSVVNNNPNIILKGKTDGSSKLYINDHLVLVESDGRFTYSIKLAKGDNLFKIISIDPAQNQTVKEFTLQFRP